MLSFFKQAVLPMSAFPEFFESPHLAIRGEEFFASALDFGGQRPPTLLHGGFLGLKSNRRVVCEEPSVHVEPARRGGGSAFGFESLPLGVELRELAEELFVGAARFGQPKAALVARGLANAEETRQVKGRHGHGLFQAAYALRVLFADVEQALAGVVEGGGLLDGLAQVMIHFLLHVDGRVNPKIAAPLVSSDGNEVFVIAIGGEQIAERVGGEAVLFVGDLGH